MESTQVPLKPETCLQIAVKDFCVVHKIPMYHSPLEGKRSTYNGHILNRMGMTKGFSDCFFPRGNRAFKGMFIELKIKPNKLTVEQSIFLEDMLAEGYDACVCYNIDEAMSVIKKFYNLK